MKLYQLVQRAVFARLVHKNLQVISPTALCLLQKATYSTSPDWGSKKSKFLQAQRTRKLEMSDPAIEAQLAPFRKAVKEQVLYYYY